MEDSALLAALMEEGAKENSKSQGRNKVISLEALKAADGFFPFDASSDAETVRSEFDMSRKLFKKALGALYRQRIVDFIDGGTRLLKKD